MFDRKSGGADLVFDGAIKPIIVFNHELKKYIVDNYLFNKMCQKRANQLGNYGEIKKNIVQNSLFPTERSQKI